MPDPCPCSFHARERELEDRIRVLADRNDALASALTDLRASVKIRHDDRCPPDADCTLCRRLDAADAALNLIERSDRT